MLTTIALGMAVVTWTAAWIALLGRFWYLRHEFVIRARSPSLVLVSLFSAFIFSTSVLWHWLRRSIGKSIPCYVIFIISYQTLAFGVTLFLIRTIRVVVAYNRGSRGRYARYVKWKPLMIVWGAATAIYAVRGFFFYGSNPVHYSSDARECFYWDDCVAVGIALFLGGGPMFILAKRLLKVNDAFQIREELALTIGICAILAGGIFTAQVLVIFNLIDETPQIHIIVEVLVLLYGTNSAVWSLLVPLVSYQMSLRANNLVVPVERDGHVEMTSDTTSALAIARAGGGNGVVFEQLCRRHLCAENWHFIESVCKYEMLASSDPDNQFDAFVAIVDQFLLATSSEEVNISSAMNKRVVSFNTRERFRSLDNGARRAIFHEPVDEVARMLDQNLLHKFRGTMFTKREAELAAAARGDTELMDLMRASSARQSVMNHHSNNASSARQSVVNHQ